MRLNRVVATWLGLQALALAGTLDVPGQFPTIQAAIDASAAGDTIVVQPGMYTEAIVLPGHDLTLVAPGGRDVTILDAEGLDASVVTAVAFGAYAVTIEGFSITGGSGTPAINGITYGGGLHLSFSLTVKVTLRDCRIVGNSARNGGAAYGGNFTLGDCEIVGNVADVAGGIYAWPATLIRYVVRDNVALKWSGGGLNGSFTLVDCVIAGNSAIWSGGGLYGNSAKQDWTGCVFVGNSAERGGGCWVSGASHNDFSPVVENSIFIGNRATLEGGAAVVEMYDYQCELPSSLIRNCVFSGNSTAGTPIALYANHNCEALPTRIENCTFLGDVIDGDFSVCSSIVRGLAQPIVAAVDVSWCNVEGGWPGTGNIDVDPLFADSAADGLHLQPASPCRNAGNPVLAAEDGATDIDGDPRVLGGRVDIGADEIAVDCNANGILDWIDLQDGTSADCEGDDVPDECEPFLDCNGNGVRDQCDIAAGVAFDCNANGVPDECEPFADCNGNGVFDACESGDCNGNGVPDLCEILSGASPDVDGNGLPDECHGLLYVPFDYPTLQAAVDAAVSGDSIVLAPGVHAGPGNRDVVVDKGLFIVGATTAAECILDGEHQGRLLLVEDDVVLVVLRLTLRNGRAPSSGGGALLAQGSATAVVRGCVLSGCQAPGWVGGAVHVRNDASLELEGCVLSGNSAAYGGALHVGGSSASVARCTFSNNVATLSTGKGGSLRAGGGSQVVVRDSILVRGAAAGGKEIELLGAGTTVDIDFCDVEGGQADIAIATGATLVWGLGNLDADPLFKDAAAGDFRLSGGSPCIDSGDPAGAPDADGTPPDMGAIPFTPFEDMGFALAGAGGAPVLTGAGTAIVGEPLTLTLSNAAPGAPCTLVLGTSLLFAPFKGGVMVPDASLLIGPLPVSANGTLVLTAPWPAGVPSGSLVWLQAWLPDAGGPAGFAASNGLSIEAR